MKVSVATTTPDVSGEIPVALLAGDFAERLDKAARFGCDGIELMVARPADLDPAAVLARVTAAGLEVAAVATAPLASTEGLTLLDPDPRRRQAAMARLHEIIGLAAALQAPVVTLGSFRGKAAPMPVAEASTLLIGMLAEAAQEAERLEVGIALEPLNRYESDIVNTADEGLALVDAVGRAGLGLLLDTFHMNIEEQSFAASLRRTMAADRLWHVHVGDSNRLPPGRGHIPFVEVVEALAETGYGGYLSAELLGAPDLDASAEITISYLQALLREGDPRRGSHQPAKDGA